MVKTMGHQLECDEWRNLKSKIWRQLKAFEVLSGLNSSLSSSILVNNLRSLVQTNIEECRVEVHPEVKIEVKSDVKEEDDAKDGNLEQDYNNEEEEELNANDYLEVEVGDQLMLENNVDQNLFEEGQHLYTTNNNTSVDPNFQKSSGNQQKQQPSSPQTQTPHRSQLTMEASENVQIDEPVQLQICQVEEEDEEASPPFSPIVSPVLQPMDKNRHESSQGSSSQLPPPLEKLPPPPPIFSAIKEKIKRRGRPMKIFPMKDAEEGGHVSTNNVNLGSPFGSYTGKKRGPKVGWGAGTICSFKDKSRVRRVKLNLKIGSNLEESLRLQKKPCRTKKMMANTEKDKLGSPISKDQRKRLVMKNQSRLYICQVCSKSLRNGAILFQHMFIHKQEFRISCTQCDRKFLQRTHLNQHMRGAHTGERPYQCRQCPSAFFQQVHLNQHMRIHNTFKKHRRTLPKMN